MIPGVIRRIYDAKNNNELLNSQWDIEKVTQFKKEWEKTICTCL